MSELPDEILRMIFCRLDGRSALRCRLVCRRWLQAMGSLVDSDWKQICYNENDDYEVVHQKYGLSWRDTYKAVNAWSRVEYSDITSQEICNGVQQFKVLPNGVLAVLQNKKNKYSFGCSDTILYYDANFKLRSKEEFNFAFFSRQYTENEYFLVLAKENGSLCIILKENKQQFIVGQLLQVSNFESLLFNRFDNFTVIGKEVYFKNSKDEIIYVSKIKSEDGVSTVVTEPLEAFKENHESFEECIVAFSMKNGELHILSDEGNKGNVYIHKDADFEWASQVYYDEPGLFLALKEFGFDWRAPPIYHWLSISSNLYRKTAFYTHGMVYLAPRCYGRVVCIHYHPDIVYGTEHVVEILKGKFQKRIFIKDFLTATHPFVNQLDIVETSTNPKILILVANKLFALEVTFRSKEGRKRKSSQVVGSNTVKRQLKSSQIDENKKQKQVPQENKSTTRANKKSLRPAKKSVKSGSSKQLTGNISVQPTKKLVQPSKKSTKKSVESSAKKSAQIKKKKANKTGKISKKPAYVAKKGTHARIKKVAKLTKHRYPTRSSNK